MRAAIARHSTNGNDDTDELDSPVDAIEQGSLSIKTNETAKKVWERPTRRPIPGAGKQVSRFEISYAHVMPPETENTNVKKYIIYDLTVRLDCNRIDSNPAVIQRRYTDFLTLFNGLKKDHPIKMQKIYFPKKVLMGNFSMDLIAQRSTAFEALLDYVSEDSTLRDSPHFVQFLQNIELTRACQLLDERRNEQAIPILENTFRVLNKVFMDRSNVVLLQLCRLVAACTTSPVPHPSADKWANLALMRYEGVSDTDLLTLYIPLLHTCIHLWWLRGRSNDVLVNRLEHLSSKGIDVTAKPTLSQAIHRLDPRTETI